MDTSMVLRKDPSDPQLQNSSCGIQVRQFTRQIGIAPVCGVCHNFRYKEPPPASIGGIARQTLAQSQPQLPPAGYVPQAG